MRHLVVLFALLVGAGALGAQSPPADSGGRVTARVVPETVTVGQPFVVSLRAIPASGRTAVPPPVPDTGGIVEPLDPANASRRGDTLLVRYRLLAWQPGVLTIPLGPVIMRRGPNEISLPVDIRVVVSSVLPADSASRIPKAPRDPFPIAARWWENWWRWVLALILGLAALYLLHRWRTRERTAAPDVVSPYATAVASLARLDARNLTNAGEGGRQVALTAEIVRQYLAQIEPSLHLALTNAELVAAVTPIDGMPVRQLAQLLDLVDAVRFGGERTDAETARRVGGLAREFLRDVERVRTVTPARAA